MQIKTGPYKAPSTRQVRAKYVPSAAPSAKVAPSTGQGEVATTYLYLALYLALY